MTTLELPYNPANRLLQPPDLDSLLQRFGIQMKPKRIDVYRKAFVHKSYCTRKNENVVNGNEQCPPGCIPLQEDSNERLEFLGDSILNLVVANYLFERYPHENEGFLTKMRTKIVNGYMLAELCKHVGLEAFILMSKQIEEGDGRNNRHILEDTFESFIAAVFHDFNECKIKSKTLALDVSGLGFQIAQTWIVGVIEDYIDFPELVRSNQNYKDMLIKYCQHNCLTMPRFREVDVTMEHGKKVFTVCIKAEDGGGTIAVGKGDSKKQAEQMASLQALKYFGQSV